MMPTVWMDTKRPHTLLPNMVECTSHVIIDGEDVQISVVAFGPSMEGTNNAFAKMERVLDRFKLGGDYRKVRVY